MPAPRTASCLAIAIVLLAGCGAPAGPPSTPAGDGSSPRTASMPPSPVALQDTHAQPFEIQDFDAVHRSIDGNAALIFGALPIEEPASDVAPDTAAFLGRWEGYGLAPPIKRDWKYVLAVTRITPTDGTAYLWAATNRQFPALVEEIRFRVTGTGPDTAIEWEQTIDGAYAVVSVRHASGTDALEGGATSGDVAGRLDDVLLRRDAAEAVVYRDHAAFLAEHGITWTPWEDATLQAGGDGALVYLPDGYEADPAREWPLIVFLHGSGDRGDNGEVLAQNSPFRFVTAGNELGAIVVAPLLDAGQATFPTAYLDGVLDDALARYRVDPDRVAVTGLSMGGESAYRLARHRPGDIAALAVLCGFDAAAFPDAQGWGYAPIEDAASNLAGVPVLVVHGRDDTIVPLAAAEQTVAALEDAGVDVRLEILEHHDHDVWSDTYADPAFFTWLLGDAGAADTGAAGAPGG